MNDDGWLAINANDGQLLIRKNLIAFFVHRKKAHEMDVRLIDGSSVEMGTVPDDIFKGLMTAMAVKDE